MSYLEPLSELAEALRRFEPPWIEVGRVYRRICFLRSEGRAAEALEIEESQFTPAVARARLSASSAFEADSVLKSLLAEEGERVSEAIALAEVLVPKLAERLSTLRSSALPAAPAATVKARALPREPRGIADFIDDMLAQDRTAAH